MNSCIISSHKDHDGGDDQDVLNARKMVIGQNQIPSYEENVVWVLICHHPTIFWKFKDQILPKLDKRVDVQLYGHMHQQAIDARKTCNKCRCYATSEGHRLVAWI